jgi:hypothetical protein
MQFAMYRYTVHAASANVTLQGGVPSWPGVAALPTPHADCLGSAADQTAQRTIVPTIPMQAACSFSSVKRAFSITALYPLIRTSPGTPPGDVTDASAARYREGAREKSGASSPRSAPSGTLMTGQFLKGHHVTSNSRELEILVAKIQKELAPNAEVLHDAKLDGRQSKTKRQIDVLVSQRIGQYEMLIVLDCKDYARPVDVKGVEEFHGIVKDVGAQKGALVCPRGFTEAAKTRATGLQIDLYSPVDTDPHKWQVRVTAPVVCDFRSAAVSFRIECSAAGEWAIPYNFFDSVVAFKTPENPLGLPLEAAMTKWNDGRFPMEPGLHRGLPIFDEAEVLVDNGYGQLVPMTLTVSLRVEQQLFFGEVPIDKISGFRDELSGAIITNAFTTGIFDADEVWNRWKRITSMNELPTQPMFALRGLVGWATN